LSAASASARLLAISDLHVSHTDNRAIVERLRPGDPGDWLIVCGDVSEAMADFEWALSLLRQRFATVIWAPGNHDLWTEPGPRPALRGEQRYRGLVEICRRLGVLTPEDDYAVWTGPGGPLTIKESIAYRLEGKTAARWVVDSRGFSYAQLATVGGDLGGYFYLYFEGAPFTYKGKTIRIKNALRLTSPLRYRNSITVSTDGGPFVNYGTVSFEKEAAPPR